MHTPVYPMPCHYESRNSPLAHFQSIPVASHNHGLNFSPQINFVILKLYILASHTLLGLASIFHNDCEQDVLLSIMFVAFIHAVRINTCVYPFSFIAE